MSVSSYRPYLKKILPVILHLEGWLVAVVLVSVVALVRRHGVVPGVAAGYRERLLAKNFESFYLHSGRKFLRTISPYNLPRRPVVSTPVLVGVVILVLVALSAAVVVLEGRCGIFQANELRPFT